MWIEWVNNRQAKNRKIKYFQIVLSLIKLKCLIEAGKCQITGKDKWLINSQRKDCPGNRKVEKQL